MGRLIAATFLGVGLTAISQASALDRFEFEQTEMAVPIRIVLYAADDAIAAKAARAAFDRIHKLNAILSDYDPQSELRRLCDNSSEGKAVRAGDDLWRVLVCAQKISDRSDGAFDVTIGPLVRLWRNARHTKELPSAESLAAARARVGYRLMRLHPDRQAVELLRPKMRLDLGGIAKGYAVDEAMKELRRAGVARMMIEAGGNLGLGDPPPDRAGWRIGVAPPDRQSPPRLFLQLSNCSISTSGDLWQHVVIRGVRYSHIIDPRDGMALRGRMSVTVIGPDGMDADALSSAVAVLGARQGLRLIEDAPGAAALIVLEVDGKEQVFRSRRWKELLEKGK